MKSRKKHILSILIVTALVTIGTRASETFAVSIPVNTSANLVHPALPMPITVTGIANIDVTGTTVNPGNFHLSGPLNAKVLIDFAPTTIKKKGWFVANGQARVEFQDPNTGSVVSFSLAIVTKGRTNSVAKAIGRFRDVAGPPNAHLRGKYHH